MSNLILASKRLRTRPNLSCGYSQLQLNTIVLGTRNGNFLVPAISAWLDKGFISLTFYFDGIFFTNKFSIFITPRSLSFPRSFTDNLRGADHSHPGPQWCGKNHTLQHADRHDISHRRNRNHIRHGCQVCDTKANTFHSDIGD